MANGQGKTLTVLLTAATAAMAGIPVQVLTANEYLARRDAEQLGPIYAALGLKVAYGVRVTEAGQARLNQLGEGMQGAWRWRRYLHEQLSCALQALHVFRKDVHYLVRDETIHIIDDTTGRLAVVVPGSGGCTR